MQGNDYNTFIQLLKKMYAFRCDSTLKTPYRYGSATELEICRKPMRDICIAISSIRNSTAATKSVAF